MAQIQFPKKKLEVRSIFTGAVWFMTHCSHLGEFIEGLKHFAVSDVKFHPQKYAVGTCYFPFSNTI